MTSDSTANQAPEKQVEKKETPDNVVKSFRSLTVDEQLAAVGLIYQEASSSIPAVPSGASTSQDATQLVNQLKKMSQDEQLQVIRDLLASQESGQVTLALDPNPFKAKAELIPGGVTPPATMYQSFSSETRLAFWAQLAQGMGSGVVSIPAGYTAPSKVKSLLNSFKSLGLEQQKAVLTQVV